MIPTRSSLAFALPLAAILAVPGCTKTTSPPTPEPDAAAEGPAVPEGEYRIKASYFPNDWYFREPGNMEVKGPPEGSRALEMKPPPPLAIKSWHNGDPITLDAMKGRIVVLFFWGSERRAAIKSVPRIRQLAEKFNDRGVTFVGIHDGLAGFDVIDEAIDAHEIPFVVGLDNGSATVDNYNVILWPNTTVIDRHGIVRASGLRTLKLEEVLDQLVAEKEAWDRGERTQIIEDDAVDVTVPSP